MTPQKGDRVLAWDDEPGKSKRMYEGEYLRHDPMYYLSHRVKIGRCEFGFDNVRLLELKAKPFPVKHNGKAIMVYRATEVDEILNQ